MTETEYNSLTPEQQAALWDTYDAALTLFGGVAGAAGSPTPPPGPRPVTPPPSTPVQPPKGP